MVLEIHPRKATEEKVIAIIKKNKVISVTKLFKESGTFYYSLLKTIENLEKKGRISIEIERIDKNNNSSVEYRTIKFIK